MKILSLVLIFVILLTPLAVFAENTIAPELNHPITFQVDGDVVNIVVFVNITGGGANLAIGGTTYAQAAIDGIIYNWSGDKDGIYVNVVIIDVADNPLIRANQRALNIIIREGTGISQLLDYRRWSPRTPGTILLFQGDFRCPIHRDAHRYRLSEFMSVSAHEFGHALGISDNTQRRDIITIMGNSVWDTTATRLDLELALMANRSRRWQRFENNLNLIRSFGSFF